MEHHSVRSPKVSGDELDQLRQKLVFLRGLPPEKAREVIDFRAVRLDLFGAVELAKTTGKILVPHGVIDRILTARDISYCRTGTMIIHEAPEEPFGEQISFESLYLKIPKQFKGKKDCALVVEYPDFDIVPLGTENYELVVDDLTRIHLLEDFPREGDYYSVDENFRIPVGEPVQYTDNARKLFRFNESYLGLLVGNDYFYGTQGVRLLIQPSDRFKVALF